MNANGSRGGLPDRSTIDDSEIWTLDRLFSDEEAWESAVSDVEARLAEIRTYDDDVVNDGQRLIAFLKLYEDTLCDADAVVTYARLKRSQEMTSKQHRKRLARARSLVSAVNEAGGFLRPALAELDETDFEALVRQAPELERYQHYFRDVRRRRERTGAEEVESVLTAFADLRSMPEELSRHLRSHTAETLRVESGDGSTKEVTASNFASQMKRPDRTFRRNTHRALFEELSEYRHSMATAYRGAVEANVATARARGYDTALEATLDTLNVPTSVYHTLVETVRDRLKPLHEHVSLKREALGVPEFRMWDRYMPVVNTEPPMVGYETASEWLLMAVEPLGSAYHDRLESILSGDRVDVREHRHKRPGAFARCTHDDGPFVLLNYQDDLSSAFTMAHELGHATHMDLARDHQPFLYSNPGTLLAEVASQVSELLFARECRQTGTDPELERHALDHYLETVRNALYRQTMFAAFEQRAHAVVESGERLNADRLDDLFGDLLAEFYAPATIDEYSRRGWLRVTQLFSPFEVYKYALGMAAALAFVDRIERGDRETVRQYVDLLRQGSNGYPLDLLADVGIDFRTGDPVEAAIDAYADAVTELETVLRTG